MAIDWMVLKITNLFTIIFILILFRTTSESDVPDTGGQAGGGSRGGGGGGGGGGGRGSSNPSKPAATNLNLEGEISFEQKVCSAREINWPPCRPSVWLDNAGGAKWESLLYQPP